MFRSCVGDNGHTKHSALVDLFDEVVKSVGLGQQFISFVLALLHSMPQLEIMPSHFLYYKRALSH